LKAESVKNKFFFSFSHPSLQLPPLLFTVWQSKMLSEFINGFTEADESGPKMKRRVDPASNKQNRGDFSSIKRSKLKGIQVHLCLLSNCKL